MIQELATEELQSFGPASFEDLGGNGQIEILIRDRFYFGLPLRFASSPLLIVQMKGSRFVDVSSRFWPVFEKEIRQERRKLNNQQMQKFRHPNADQIRDADYKRTKSTVLLIILDYMNAGRPEEAKEALRELWPSDSQVHVWWEMLREYCSPYESSGLRRGLKLDASPACAEYWSGRDP